MPSSHVLPHTPTRKIIHIDMDCFYAAIEERDNPSLRGKPLGVGGSNRRSVLTTANYLARKSGCRSAMPVFIALEKCPELIIVPTRFDTYKHESRRIREILSRFTHLIEPLSLDEAFLDVTHLTQTATETAKTIRHLIRQETGLTASAGIGPNKLIAKIASDWRKPDGQFTVPPPKVPDFMRNLPIKKIPGVGSKMAERLAAINIQTCGQYRDIDKFQWVRRLGSWGAELHERCWGRDDRPVTIDQPRKSLSIENTFFENLSAPADLEREMSTMLDELEAKLATHHSDRHIRSLLVKLKFADFQQTTAERANPDFDRHIFPHLLHQAHSRSQNPNVRLIGVGTRFHDIITTQQLELFPTPNAPKNTPHHRPST